MPRRRAHPALAASLHGRDHPIGGRVASASAPLPKRTSTWLSTTSFTTSTPSAASSWSANRVRKRAAAIDQLGNTADRARLRGPRRETSRAARRLGHEVARTAQRASTRRQREVRRGVGHRGRVHVGVRAEHVAASRTGRSAICVRRSPRSRRARYRPRGGGSPGSPPPRARTHRRRGPTRRARVRLRSRRGEVVARAGVHVARLQHDDRRSGRLRSRAPREVGSTSIAPLPSAATSSTQRRSETEQAQRAVDGRVALDARRSRVRAARRSRPSRSTSWPTPRQHVSGGPPPGRPCSRPARRSRNRTTQLAGVPRSSFNHSPLTSSTTAAAGAETALYAG